MNLLFHHSFFPCAFLCFFLFPLLPCTFPLYAAHFFSCSSLFFSPLSLLIPLLFPSFRGSLFLFPFSLIFFSSLFLFFSLIPAPSSTFYLFSCSSLYCHPCFCSSLSPSSFLALSLLLPLIFPSFPASH